MQRFSRSGVGESSLPQPQVKLPLAQRASSRMRCTFDGKLGAEKGNQSAEFRQSNHIERPSGTTNRKRELSLATSLAACVKKRASAHRQNTHGAPVSLIRRRRISRAKASSVICSFSLHFLLSARVMIESRSIASPCARAVII